jgi:peptidoglycan-N-acetylmuramic acid deacetylase
MSRLKVSTLFLIVFFMAEMGAILSNTLSLYYDTTQAAAREFMWYYLPHDEEEQPEPMEKAGYLKDYDVIYIGSPDRKVIYLTFDDCPENGNISSILDVLEEHHAPAAFFMTEVFIRKHPDVIRRIDGDGYLVCNHTAHHVSVTRLSFDKLKAEIKGVEDAFREVTGKELDKYFRPPQGKFNETSLSYTEELGYTTVFWSFRYTDWEVNNQPSEDAAYNTIMKETHPGEIVLLHCQSKTNVKVLDRVLDSWEQQGYTFGSIADIQKKQVSNPQ